MKQSNSLSRRCFLKLSGTASLGLALSACGVSQPPTLTPSSTNTALPVATPTATATATITPAPTNTPSATPPPTETPVPTLTPSATLPPTEMPAALKTWTSEIALNNLAYGYLSWTDPRWSDLSVESYDGKPSGEMEIIDHPLLGKAFGYRVLISGDWQHPYRTHHGKYLPRYNGNVNWRMEWNIVFGDDGLPRREGSAALIGSCFSHAGPVTGGGVYRPLAAADVYYDRILLSVKEPITGGKWIEYETRRKFFLTHKLYRVALYTSGPNVYFAVDEGNLGREEIWVSGPLHPDNIGVSPVFVHTGLYGYGTPVGSSLFNGPLTVSISAQ